MYHDSSLSYYPFHRLSPILETFFPRTQISKILCQLSVYFLIFDILNWNLFSTKNFSIASKSSHNFNSASNQTSHIIYTHRRRRIKYYVFRVLQVSSIEEITYALARNSQTRIDRSIDRWIGLGKVRDENSLTQTLSDWRGQQPGRRFYISLGDDVVAAADFPLCERSSPSFHYPRYAFTTVCYIARYWIAVKHARKISCRPFSFLVSRDMPRDVNFWISR